MPCTPFQIGTVRGIYCARGKKSKPKLCTCGREATRLCDFKIGKRKTCSRGMCDACTFSPEDGKDFCAEHRAAVQQQPATGELDLG